MDEDEETFSLYRSFSAFVIFFYQQRSSLVGGVRFRKRQLLNTALLTFTAGVPQGGAGAETRTQTAGRDVCQFTFMLGRYIWPPPPRWAGRSEFAFKLAKFLRSSANYRGGASRQQERGHLAPPAGGGGKRSCSNGSAAGTRVTVGAAETRLLQEFIKNTCSDESER